MAPCPDLTLHIDRLTRIFSAAKQTTSSSWTFLETTASKSSCTCICVGVRKRGYVQNAGREQVLVVVVSEGRGCQEGEEEKGKGRMRYFNEKTADLLVFREGRQLLQCMLQHHGSLLRGV